jgi:hypothetical protein
MPSVPERDWSTVAEEVDASWGLSGVTVAALGRATERAAVWAGPRTQEHS